MDPKQVPPTTENPDPELEIPEFLRRSKIEPTPVELTNTPAGFAKPKVVEEKFFKAPPIKLEPVKEDPANKILGFIDHVEETKYFNRPHPDVTKDFLDTLDWAGWIREKGLPRSILFRVKNTYTSLKDELQSIAKDPQLQEGYKHLTRQEIGDRIRFYTGIIEAADLTIENKNKLRKPMTVKKSVEKLIKNIVLAKSDPISGVGTLPPEKIPLSETVVFYNIKTRTLLVYSGIEFKKLSVNSKTLVGYDPKLSYSMTIRKPKETITAISTATTRKAVDNLINKLTTKKVPLNKGRVSDDMILVKAF